MSVLTRAAMRLTLNKAETLNIENRGLTAQRHRIRNALEVALNDSKKQTPWCPIRRQRAGHLNRQSPHARRLHVASVPFASPARKQAYPKRCESVLRW